MGDIRLQWATLAAILALGAPSALAHPGPKILSSFGDAERRDATDGVSVEYIHGVHLFNGPRALAGQTNDARRSADGRRIEIERVSDRPFRTIRRLRTQGFYSGNMYPSRRYTHGFYSGR